MDFLIIIIIAIFLGHLFFDKNKKDKKTKIKTENNLKEVINFIYIFTLSEATKASKDIIKSEFFKDKDRNIEEKKLQFDLCFPFLVVAADCIYRTRLNVDTKKNIMDGVCDLYFNGLKEFNQTENLVDSSFFIKNKSERLFFLKQNPVIKNSTIDEFDIKTSLYTIAVTLFDKRFLEYKELYKIDIQNLIDNKPPFKMVLKFYENWSGEKGYPGATNFEFLMGLFMRISSFHHALSKYLYESFFKENINHAKNEFK